jgi:uncharacterized membrane protein
MGKARLEAFSDGVIAIIITIMVLELKIPRGSDLAALGELVPVLLGYVLSFVFVGIYWNNHHHLMHVTRVVDGRVLWANLHLLFWLSLIPFGTAWIGENRTAAIPTAAYGVILFMAGIAWLLLQRALVACSGGNPELSRAIGSDFKGKASGVTYAVAVGLAFVHWAIADALYALVAVMWIVPDSRFERAVRARE